MRSQKEIELLSNITNSNYLQFLVSGECISENSINEKLNDYLYYSTKVLFENLSTDIVISLKDSQFYILVKEISVIHLLGPLNIDFKNLEDSTFVSYSEITAIARLFYYLITGSNLYSHIPRFVDESYKYYKGEKYFFNEDKIFGLEEQPNFTKNNHYQLFNIFSISLKEKNKNLLKNYFTSLLEEDLFEELLKDYSDLGVNNISEIRLQKNILIHALSQLMYYQKDYVFKSDISDDLFFEIINDIEVASDITQLKQMAYNFIDRILELVDNCSLINSQYIHFATNYIKTNINQKITLDIVSDKLSISSKYLSKLFKKELNISFKDYLIETRIERAKKLLLFSDKSIRDISLEVGISNSNNFIAFFKNYTSITPSAYRKRKNYSLKKDTIPAKSKGFE